MCNVKLNKEYIGLSDKNLAVFYYVQKNVHKLSYNMINR